MKPTVAIVGRPNVGKSTLFNRIVRAKKAIVEDAPGVSRDRNYGEIRWESRCFAVIDTGGFEPATRRKLWAQIREQIWLAMEEANLILFLMDGKDGLTPADQEIDRLLRRQEKPVVYGVNKIDGPEHEAKVFDFYTLGVDRIFSISAAHGYGVGEILTEIAGRLPEQDVRSGEGRRIGVAVVGRPNVGKSSWINRILGQERLLVDERPGTTRDAIDTPFEIGPRKYVLIDTAGIRRKKKISERLEKYAVAAALKSIDRCDVALFLLDPFEGVTEQDARIGGFIHEKGRACVIAMNKWDLVKKDTMTAAAHTRNIRDSLRHLSYAPIVYVSALTGQRVRRTLELVDRVAVVHQKRIGTGQLNMFLRQLVEEFPPPARRGKKGRIYYMTQAAVQPPTFVAFVNAPDLIHFSYERHIRNKLRDRFGFEGTPIRIHFRARGGSRGGPSRR